MACDLNIGSQSAAERGHILLESGLYSDLVLEVGEGAEMVKFNVHRCTLTLASSVWATTVNWAESGVIKITQFPFTTIKAVIYYIYTKTIDFQGLAHWQEVMSAAHFYDMQELQYRCEEHIQNYFKKDCVTVKEMIEILNKATLYNSRNIISSCIAFIEDNVNLVFESDCFLDLSLDSLLAIIGSDRAFSTEAFQINHVLRWSQHAMEQSKQEDLREFLEATTILSHFRLNKLLPDELKTLNLHYPNILTGKIYLECGLPVAHTSGLHLSDRVNQNLDMQIKVRSPPMVICEHFVYSGPSITFTVFSIEIEARYNSINSSFLGKHEEKFSVTIGDTTAYFDSVVPSRVSSVLIFPTPVHLVLQQNTVIDIYVQLDMCGTYWKNSKFGLLGSTLVRRSCGIIMNINNNYARVPSALNEQMNLLN